MNEILTPRLRLIPLLKPQLFEYIYATEKLDGRFL